MTISIEGIDYSQARPGGAAIKAAGKHFVGRYLYPVATGGKGIGQREVDDLQSHGLDIFFIYEGSARGVLGGAAQGTKDAKIAQQQLEALNGVADDRLIYAAADTDVQPAQYGALDDYLRAFGHVLGGRDRVGIYGSHNVIEHAYSNGLALLGFQSLSTGWSGSSTVAPHAALWQYGGGHINGGGVDLTRAIKAYFGQHTSKPTKAPASTPAKTYTVKPGDTLSSIALKVNIPLSVLEAKNTQIHDFNRITPGQVINL